MDDVLNSTGSNLPDKAPKNTLYADNSEDLGNLVDTWISPTKAAEIHRRVTNILQERNENFKWVEIF